METTKIAIERSLLEKYGPLISLPQLAELLHRSPDGLRIAMSKPHGYAQEIKKARIKIGRRVYFRTPEIAEYIASAE
ncbi:DNA-binding protein [Kushneria phosphatilytica]|uniref:DNA-binding protein n=1 Tax=Kushneria phosphatilytica TaxID=657387 RepID=UPI001F2DC154|nr:DNA-binding protein [Kushneria phosphatilytica]